MYQLIFIGGPLKGKRLTIRKGSVLLGQDSDCHVPIPDHGVAPKQAVVEQRPDGIYIRNLAVTSGISVNRRAVQEIRLNDRDVIEFSSTRIEFHDLVHGEPHTRRHMSRLQALTLLGVVIVLVFEASLVLWLCLWRNTVPPVSVNANASTGTVVATSSSESQLLAQAEARLKAAEQKPQVPTNRPAEVKPSTASASQEVRLASAEADQVWKEVEAPAAKKHSSRVPLSAPAATNIAITPPIVPATGGPAVAALSTTTAVAAATGEKKGEQAVAEAKKPESKSRWAKFWSSFGSETVEKPVAAVSATTTQAVPAAVAEEPKTPPPPPLPQNIRIVSVEPQKFPENDQFEEMRLLRITLQPTGDTHIDSTKIRVSISFFDEDRASRAMEPTRAVVPTDLLRVDSEWHPGEEHVVTVAYLLPRGFRAEELQKYRQNRRYFGYIVGVYYDGQLQDVENRPKALASKVEDLLPRRLPGALELSPAASAITSSETNSAR